MSSQQFVPFDFVNTTNFGQMALSAETLAPLDRIDPDWRLVFQGRAHDLSAEKRRKVRAEMRRIERAANSLARERYIRGEPIGTL